MGEKEIKGWRVKKDTNRENKERECQATEKEAALGNDPKVRQGIKYGWLPVTNLAAVSAEEPHSGHFLGG